MRHTGSVRRPGFTLIEIATVLTIVGLLLALGMGIIATALKADRSARKTLLRLSARAQVADRFRGDVAAAVEAPDKLGAWSAGPSCLILRRAEGVSVIYRWHDGGLDRIEGKIVQPIALGDDCREVVFKRPDSKTALISMRLSDGREWSKTDSGLEIAAALGGNTR